MTALDARPLPRLVEEDARGRTSATAVAALVAGALTLLLASARLVLTPRYYYYDDTQTGAVGQWWELGERLTTGEWSILSPSRWQAGNYLAEGQWGLLSPLTSLIALLTRASEDMVVAATIVKVSLLVLTAVGTVLLLRSFGSSATWAIAAGVATPLIGFTAYMDAPSWVTGLVTSSLFPWAWWGLRRASIGRNPSILLVASSLLVTAGYVFGVLALATLMIATLIQHAVRSERAAALRVLLAGGIIGAISLVIYLPAILTSSVSVRASTAIDNDNFLNADLSDLLAASIPTGSVSIQAWWGAFPGAPLQYVAWFVPLVLLALPCARRTLVDLVPAGVTAVTMLLLVIGPSAVGPLRFPVRMMPYLGIAVIVIVIVLLSRVDWSTIPRGRWIGVSILLAAGGFAAWSQQPETLLRVALAVGAGVAAIAVLRLLAVGRIPPLPRLDASRTAALVVVATSAALTIPQIYWLPASPLPDFGAESEVEELDQILPEARGDTFVVGSALERLRTGGDEVLAANLWYFAEPDVQNTYTVLQYREYAEELCMDLRGSTCQSAFETLFDVDRLTDEPLADLLAISSVLVLEEDGRSRAPKAPDGWSMTEQGDAGWLFVRDEEIPGAGGVAWTAPGVDLRIDELTETGIRATVLEDVDSGAAVLSRLAWPGYTVDGATLADPHRGYLLAVDLAGARAGDTIAIEFRPPAWSLLAGGGILALAVGLAWSAWAAVAARRDDRPSVNRAGRR
ncbi:YfhO family protein [Microcella flavibacter]|uniref:YfhO family protein n=1 Tax=Microcella flavibacter TaxID=1804990 RepID=UPI001456917F|nr:YfhO family protein [Microcella flavibacter]